MDVFALKSLAKLASTVAGKGIGSLLRPWQMRREGVAEVEVKRLKALTAAQTKVDVADIQAGKKVFLPSVGLQPVGATSEDSSLIISRVGLMAEFEQIVQENVQKEAFRREISVAKAVLYAEKELEQETQPPSDEPVSDDWLLRWRDNAGSISSEEMQALWGRVLAGEVKRPHSFSLRTLDFLRNIEPEDAKLIERAASYVIANTIFRPEVRNGLVGTLRFADLVQLQDLGIIFGVESSGLLVNYESHETASFLRGLRADKRIIIVRADDSTKVLSIESYGLTQVGREMLRLSNVQPDETHLRATAERIKRLGFQTQLADALDNGDGSCQYYNAADI